MRCCSALLALLAFAAAARAPGEVRIVVGPTPIPAGSARAPGDLTVVNERLAFALAVESAAPYGVPRGALVDLAPVRDGVIGHDRVVFADFIPDNWSAWPNTFHRVDVLERGPLRVRIRAVRDFGAATVTTLYTLAAGSDQIAIETTLRNGGTQALTLHSGLTLWPSSGFLFPVPGLAGVTEGPAAAALARRVVAYDADWTITLHAPYLDYVGSGSRDLLQRHTLAPGESRRFAGWLQVGASGDLAPVVAAEISRRHLAAGVVHGSVLTHADAPLAEPVVVVEKDGKPYAWSAGRNGRYGIALPVGEYSLYATGRNYSRSTSVAVTVRSGADRTLDFADLRDPGRVELEVRDAHRDTPLDARIVIREGEQPLVEFLGRRTFFTELDRRGTVALPIAPGDYVLGVSAGGGFLAPEAKVRVHVDPGGTTTTRVAIDRLFDPAAQGWYAADLHHHADQAEAVTPPQELARSQLAAGLDVLFVSDHDSMANHVPLRAIAAARGVPFIPGIELSPSWGHFNAYPIAPGERLAVDTSTADVKAILAEARREGASVVQVNHPFIPFGYFTSVAAGVAPGGLSDGFDLVEINASVPQDDAKVLARVWDYWNAGRRHYLTAGSDTHDVWNEESGRVRVFVHPDGPLTAASFVAALSAGHAYVSYGPLIFPSVIFGTRPANTAAGPLRANFGLAAVAGLKRLELVADGVVESTREFPDAPREARVELMLEPGRSWYALTVEDQAGRSAYSNPIWMNPATPAHAP